MKGGNTTTRIVVKNIPKKATADDLRAFFENHGFSLNQITLKNQLAFCGLRDPTAAQAVVDKLHHAYFRTSKLSIEFARSRKEQHDASLSATNKKRRTESSMASAQQQEPKKKPKQQTTKQQFWADGDSNREEEMQLRLSSSQHQQQQSDLDFLKSKQQKVSDLEQPSDNSVSECRLYVSNLPYTATTQEVREYLETFGELSECKLIREDYGDEGTNLGYGFVRFVDAQSARSALEHSEDFQGRLLHIEYARAPPRSDPTSSSFKDSREQHRQKDAGTKKDQHSWMSSFVRSDAVVHNLAVRLGLKQSDVLNVKDNLSGGDAAVRLALAETSIIEENRKYFEQYCIDMEALVSLTKRSDNNNTQSSDSATMERSKTSFLVKNLPADTTVEDLEKLFDVNDPTILLPPSRTIAVIQYQNSSDAKYAFRKHAYRRFKSVPLYLEWAPLASHVDNRTDATAQNDAKPTEATANDEEDGQVVGPNATLFVKNLNFSTTEQTLEHFFNEFGVRMVRIPQKVGPVAKNQQQPAMLSMGYGFVEFRDRTSAQKALKARQGQKLDGHVLELQSSTTTAATGLSKAVSTNIKSATSKLMVRNVPFQANRKELLQLFGSFGQLKKLRLPKKFDGTHRGFAFVEYLTSKEAESAMKSLSRTHLYGRHLVIEMAENEDESLQSLRQKAERDISLQPKGKKIRFD